MTRIFVSHAHTDIEIVKLFISTILESGIGVRPQEIFCSSIQPQGIEPGIEFKQEIHNKLRNCSIFIPLLTDNFFNSDFCMCELGGCWALNLRNLPVIVPPVEFKSLRGILPGIQALEINSEGSLDTIKDIIENELNLE